MAGQAPLHSNLYNNHLSAPDHPAHHHGSLDEKARLTAPPPELKPKGPLLDVASAPLPPLPHNCPASYLTRHPARCTALALFCLLLAYLMTGRSSVCHLPAAPLVSRPVWSAATSTTRLVPLEAHIMSKCPDARDCLLDLVLPAMQQASDKVNFTLSYIGQTTNRDDAVVCKHGVDECLGNIIELCAADLYPDPKTFLGFATCLTRDYQHIPQESLVSDCTLEHGIDFDKLNSCLSKDDGQYGMDLLRASVTRSAQANVTKSCTVRLNEEIRCIRDGGEWYDCDGGSSVDSLVQDIADLYEKLNE